MTSETTSTETSEKNFRIGLTSPINLTALQAVIGAVQAIWPEGKLGTPGKGEAAVILVPKAAFINGEHIVPQDVADTVREERLVEEDALANQSEITIMSPGAVEMTPPPAALNILSGYCHALLDSLPKGSSAIQQTIHIPGRAEPYVLSIQPKSQSDKSSPVEWEETEGWVSGKPETTEPSPGDLKRRQLLQRVSSMGAVSRVLSKTTKSQIAEALRTK